MFNEWRVGPARAGALRFEGASACGERMKRTGQTKGARAQGLGLRTEGVRLSLPPHLRGMSGDIAPRVKAHKLCVEKICVLVICIRVSKYSLQFLNLVKYR